MEEDLQQQKERRTKMKHEQNRTEEKVNDIIKCSITNPLYIDYDTIELILQKNEETIQGKTAGDKLTGQQMQKRELRSKKKNEKIIQQQLQKAINNIQL